ncbi:MAG: XRE family transcriptional regulator [Candidatus Parabeggiatoa sp. nov. 3]|nr:MAG: XRE family transcriptional regulator [Gammaproteobacteria bacterium]RKZ65282.1 MAG: XRE family transcriptional regulator [Gammaproteobacteria bacterium]RKZ81870.1 MAG: XRE family transcriptional regulator [Gammaproteobacteria bacterium]
MQVYEKIKVIRQLKGWSQEEIAHRLNMSVSGYGSIERGETDVNLSRLEKIAKVFEIDLSELFNLNEKNSFHVGDNHTVHVGDNQTLHNSSNINSFSKYDLQQELEKSHLIIEQQNKEIEWLKQQNADLREQNTDLRTMIEFLQKP